MSELKLLEKNIIGSVTSKIFIGYIKDEEEMNQNIIKTIDNEIGDNSYKTNVKAQMTGWHMHSYSGFDKLCGIIMKTTGVIGSRINDTFLDFKLVNIWGCKYKSNEETISHDHWPNVWSIAYFLYPPKDCSELVFTEFDYVIKPEHGMLVIFPGHYLHQVNKKPFEGYRYVVSANIR